MLLTISSVRARNAWLFAPLLSSHSLITPACSSVRGERARRRGARNEQRSRGNEQQICPEDSA